MSGGSCTRAAAGTGDRRGVSQLCWTAPRTDYSPFLFAGMLEALFAFLFKYPPAIFEKGDLAFGAPGSVILLLLAAAAMGLPAVLTYARVRGRSTVQDRWVLGSLRAVAILVVIACLLRPMLLLSAAVPQRNYVGVLVDDSRSMQIADEAGKPRSDFVKRELGGADSALLKALSDRFVVRLYRFSSTAVRVDDLSQLGYSAGETRLGDALERAREDLESLPLSGLVVVSDGADNSRAPLEGELLSLRSRAVPVFTVGVGREHFDRDIEVRGVAMPRTALEGSAFVADVFVRQRGYGGIRVPIVVEEDGVEVARQHVVLPADDNVAPVHVRVTARKSGPRAFTFRIPLQPGELVPQNNVQTATVFVRRGREKILYVEGEPRYEAKFIREAIAGDSALQLVVLQRTAAGKYLRLDVDGPDELSAGFPASRTDLFRYRAVILGSMEASAFTRDQLQMLADFVNVRGGGLLVLGGRRAFAEGGYAGTPLAEALPIVITGDAVPDSLTFFADLAVRQTPVGASHPVVQLDSTASASGEHWEKLPVVTTVNRIRGVKAGAVVLLEGDVPKNGRSGAPGETVRDYRQPVLVYQRYGRGLAAALPVQDTWNWRMGATVAVEDHTYELFWRQLLRWVAGDSPGMVATSITEEQVAPGGTVHVHADVVDSSYLRSNDAVVTLHVRGPRGDERSVPMEWDVDTDGSYRASFTAADAGEYAVRVEAKTRTGALAQDSAFVRAAPSSREFFDAEMRAPLLRRIAKATGGRFYTPATVRSLPEDLALTKRGITVVRQMDLWDMPAVLLLLIGLMATEWWYRKGRGLA